jgi:hypothetical protein
MKIHTNLVEPQSADAGEEYTALLSSNVSRLELKERSLETRKLESTSVRSFEQESLH